MIQITNLDFFYYTDEHCILLSPISVVVKALCYKPEGRGLDTR
jgi:hypothetical protein